MAQDTPTDGFLWGLAALGPMAIGTSNPSVFIVASVGLALAIPVLKTRSTRTIGPFALFGLASVATFLVLMVWVNEPQSDNVMPWMCVYWAGRSRRDRPRCYSPGSVRGHTSQMFAYPAGGDIGASSLTTVLVLIAIAAYVRRG